ncbi:MAG TPA: signal peptide peptidase SppA [Methanosarcinaceae archaeon]|nr:signal peptide peptidase SppA [Methanosarcinaceae archaeon]
MISDYTLSHHTMQDDPVPQEQIPKRKGRKKQYIAVVMILILVIGASFAAIYYSAGGEFYTKDDRVAVIYVQGTMLSGSIPGGLGYVTSEEISDYIQDAVEDESIRAIVLRINSPGGSPAAAEEIVAEIKKAQAEDVPIVVSMGDVAASAAYYISAPTDMIYANPSTMTGSIGVIWTFENMSGYYEEEGIEFHVAKSGEFKDMGGPWRGLSDDEKEYADTVIIEVYNRFVDEVASGRNMSRSDVKDLADGRIYTGAKAKNLGLVDDFGNMYDAIEMASELGGIDGEPTVIYMNKPTLSRLLFGSDTGSSQTIEKFVGYFEDNPFGKIT